jgi:hypothetical protein
MRAYKYRGVLPEPDLRFGSDWQWERETIERWRRQRERSKPAPVQCAARNCDRTAHAKGLCNRHYQNQRQLGRVIPRRDFTVAEVIEQVGFTETHNGCREWNGKRNEHGYGIINVRRAGVEDQRVHRVMFELHVRPLEPGEWVRHACDNPPCAKLSHLLPGTPQDNSNDMIERRRHWKHDRQACEKGHDLTTIGATRDYADGSKCVLCHKERQARYGKRRRS